MNATADAGDSSGRPQLPPTPALPARWLQWSLVALLLALGLWVAWTSARLVLADVVSLSARSHVRQWSQGTLATTDAQVAKADFDIQRGVRLSPDDPNAWEDLGEVQVLLAKRAGTELLRRAATPANAAASAAKIASAAEAASRPARSLEEFRRRAKQRELEAQRQALRGSEPEPEPVPVAAAPAPLSDDELKLAIRSHFERARDAYLQSIALRPAWPAVWARLAGVHLALEQREPYLKAWNQALKLGPHESNVQAECLELVLIDWDQAQPAQHEWAKKLYDDASESKRKAINRVAARFGLLFEAEEVPAPR